MELDTETNELYNMDLMDILHISTVEPYEILRVPGGWVFTRFCNNGISENVISTCFVPFDNEFQLRY